MKKHLIWGATLLLSHLLCYHQELHAAWLVVFLGSAMAIDWSEVREHVRRTGSFTFCGPVTVATLPVTHEDLSDAMVLLEPEEMMFVSALPKGRPAENVSYKAPVDKLDDPRLGGLRDGQKVNRDNVKNRQQNRKQLNGTIQHMRETYGSTIVAQQVQNPAGITDVIADGKAKTILALKQKMELTFLSDQDCNEIGSSDAGLTRGAIMWASSDAQPNNELKVPDGYRPLAAQRVAVANVAAITEAQFKTMLLNLRIARHKKIDVLAFCTLEAGAQFDSWFTEQIPVAGSAVPSRRFNFDGDAEIFEQMVTTYATRYGRITPNPTEYLNGLRDSASGLTGNTTNGSAVITGLANVPTDDDGDSALQTFSPISGTGIPAGAYIVSVDSATQITISENATADGAAVELALGVETHMFFTDIKFWDVRTNLVPSHKPLPEDSGGEDGYCETITSLFNTYPALLGMFYSN